MDPTIFNIRPYTICLCARHIRIRMIIITFYSMSRVPYPLQVRSDVRSKSTNDVELTAHRAVTGTTPHPKSEEYHHVCARIGCMPYRLCWASLLFAIFERKAIDMRGSSRLPMNGREIKRTTFVSLHHGATCALVTTAGNTATFVKPAPAEAMLNPEVEPIEKVCFRKASYFSTR